MLDIPVFWLGPLGRLVPLACPEPNVSNTIEMQAATNTSVNMRRTIDLQGFRRTWVLNQAYLDAEDVAVLEGMFNGMVMPPLRIIDPLRKNRFRPSVSAPRLTSLWGGSVNGWHAPVGGSAVVTSVANSSPNVTYTSPGDARAVAWRPDENIRWVAQAPGEQLMPNGAMKPDGLTVYKSRVDPLLRNEPVTWSFWARVTGDPFTAIIASVNQFMQPTATASTVSVSSSAWTKYSITYTPISTTIWGMMPLFQAVGAFGILDIAQMQLESGNVASQWEPGHGAPECAITQFNTVSPRFPLITANLTIQEL